MPVLKTKSLMVVSSLLIFSCADFREKGEGTPYESECGVCHGTPENPAPPPDVEGRNDTTLRGVGAHASHLNPEVSQPVKCGDCHKVPALASDQGHLDTAPPAEVVFSDLASNNGSLKPTILEIDKPGKGDGIEDNGEEEKENEKEDNDYDLKTVKCVNVYCHGATLSGGSGNEPIWTVVDGSYKKCDSCHGFPPVENHTSSKLCYQCHGAVVDAEGKVIDKTLHLDGKISLSLATSCKACHGSDKSPAPPPDLSGSLATSSKGVGAHENHLFALKGFSKPIECSECHTVPQTVDAEGHIDGTEGAEVSFGTLAKNDGADPQWDKTSLKCSNLYCHGGTLLGGKVTQPVWNLVDGSQVFCGSCHSIPPQPPHVEKEDCFFCHAATVDKDKNIIGKEEHINGAVNISISAPCNYCHGSDDNFAPPVDLAGKSDTSLVSVGAHQSHIMALNAISTGVACSECHKVPSDPNDPAHLDGDNKAEVEFGTLAKKEGLSPEWTEGATCKNVYCHGASLDGGNYKEPLWTKVDSSQVKCDSCHGYPPSGDKHPPQTNCGMCHDGVADAAGNILKPSLHINGEVEEPEDLKCNSCHGSNENDAPPKDIAGNTATSYRGVGAHQAHINGSKYGTPVECGECHKKPAEIYSEGHLDTPLPAEVTFGPLAKKDNPGAMWDGTKCSNIYCHGSIALGGTLTTPQWTKVDGSQSACGSCHSLPPPPPHPQFSTCSDCHGSVVKSNLEIIKNGKHNNGQVDF